MSSCTIEITIGSYCTITRQAYLCICNSTTSVQTSSCTIGITIGSYCTITRYTDRLISVYAIAQQVYKTLISRQTAKYRELSYDSVPVVYG